ncbi:MULTISPECIES: hypothetical protein [unclassified Carboxylicivirga]|uniref:hypothetical protein n=1 Tax=Carboxylicivirga TaxID=1628153 RepID=UPI003D32CB01
MFGLETISHWQFIKAIALCLAGYYIILLLYLTLKKVNESQTSSFEAEALQANKAGFDRTEEPSTKSIRASDYPSVATSYVEQDEQDLRVTMNQEPDYSGYALDAIQNTQMADKDAFLNNIEYELQHS